MAHFVLKDAVVTVNSVALSDHVRSVNIGYEAEIVDDTAMGDNSRNKLAGLKNWTADIEFAQDFAASEVDATLFSLIGSTDFAFVVRPTSSARSATNPDFSGRALLASYPPLDGSIGEVATVSVTFEGTGDLSRKTSST